MRRQAIVKSHFPFSIFHFLNYQFLIIKYQLSIRWIISALEMENGKWKNGK